MEFAKLAQRLWTPIQNKFSYVCFPSRFPALTSGWMCFICKRCPCSLMGPITEICVSQTLHKFLVLLGHIFPGAKIISVNGWTWRICHSVQIETFCLVAIGDFWIVLGPCENDFLRSRDVFPCSRTSAWFWLVYCETNTKRPLQMNVELESAQRRLGYK